MNRTIARIALLLVAGASLAQPLVPSPSVPSVANDDGWAAGLGLGVEYEAEYDGSDDYSVEAEPAFLVQYRTGDSLWFIEGAELGWRRRAADRWLVQAGLRYEFGREEDEAPELAGLGDVDDELTGMVEARYALTADWGNWVAGRAMAGDSDIGALGVLAAGHTFDMGEDGSGIDVFVFATFGTADFINRDFGVTPEQSEASGLPLTDLDGGYRSAGISVVGRWFIGERWQVVAEAGYERYSSEIGDSPVALNDYETEVGLSVVYQF